ncbi:heterokaryon incompatibility protein-domain-containing protein [Paraphoma chrysanthemicola]|uniref:Heterokaryon incompatibility protein-domain-containing protein n=1 Tax=Paraphoma chrysanthemicola TaxID=798071 RepID=A0A8K0W5K1_9PLEO|nr:heterokaryon incompatibility protein-domain-containing protein [Paraphoma chrysanthemicola]
MEVATSGPDAYKHQPLEYTTSIRVLVLHPAGTLGDPIEGTICQVDRIQMLEGWTDIKYYEAVSYSWGGSNKTHTMSLSACMMSITHNVDTMLRYLRSGRKERYLWIDAICLDQCDLEEMITQIPLMGDIYRQAAKVRVWLGERTLGDGIPGVFAALKIIATGAARDGYADTGRVMPWFLKIGGKTYPTDVQCFFKRDWFCRRWVLQEVAMGHDITIHCGELKLAWEWLIDGVSCLLRSDELTVAWGNVSTIVAVQTMQDYYGKTLLELLWTFHASQCSEPKDVIFSIRGMATDSAVFGDTRYLDEWKVTFTTVAQHYFEYSQTDMWKHLAHFGSLYASQDHGSAKYANIPSWVPNWRSQRMQLWLPGFFYNFLLSDTPPLTIDRTGSRILRLCGPYLGQLKGQDAKARLWTSYDNLEDVDHLERILETILFTTQKESESVQSLRNYVRQNPEFGLIVANRIPSALSRICENPRGIRGHVLDVLVEHAIKEILADFQIIFLDARESSNVESAAESTSETNPHRVLALAPPEARDGDIVLRSQAEKPRVPEILGVNREYREEPRIGVIVRPVDQVNWANEPKPISGPSREHRTTCRFVGFCMYPGAFAESRYNVGIDLV